MIINCFREFELNGHTGSYLLYHGALTVRIAGKYKSAPLVGVHLKVLVDKLARELLAEGSA